MITQQDEWVQIAELTDKNQIVFTKQYIDLMGELDWEAKAFAAHIITLWYDPFEHVLDYHGDAEETADQPGGESDTGGMEKPQDVVEYWAQSWARHGSGHKEPHRAGLDVDVGVEWYRDVLRAKLVTIKLPKRLLLEYRDPLLKHPQEIEAEHRQRQDKEGPLRERLLRRLQERENGSAE